MFNRTPPPFAKDRCDQLRSNPLPDYGTKTDSELKAEMRDRGLELRGRRKTAHWVKALQASDQHDLKLYKDWKDRDDFDKNLDYRWELPLTQDHAPNMRRVELRPLLDARQDRMFASKYKEDTSRKNFLDLPGEIRNIIYKMALFNLYNFPIGKFSIVATKRQLLMWHRALNGWQYHDELTVATLNLLGAVSKQIRKESRALYWAKLKLNLTDADAPQHDAMQAFLTMLGPEARASIPKLRCPGHPDPSPTGCASFSNLLPTLALCLSLRELDLKVYVANIFREDVDALRIHFLAGQPLVSPGLEKLTSTIMSLPLLTNVHLKFASSHVLCRELDPDIERFLYFAFSGMREMMLWMEIRERLQANYARSKEETRKFNSKTFIWIDHPHWAMFDEGNDTMDYEAWVKWHNTKYPGGLDEEGVASIPLDTEEVEDDSGKTSGSDTNNAIGTSEVTA